MKKKMMIVFVVIICAFIFWGLFEELLSHHDHQQPTTYSSIEELENDLDIKCFQLYDLGKLIMDNQKILLQDEENEIYTIIGDHSDQEIYYALETNELISQYEIRINPSIIKPMDKNSCRQDKVGKGMLYQYHYKEDDYQLYIGIFVKRNIQIEFSFRDRQNIKDEKLVEEKMIQYMNLVEELNE